VKLAAAVAVAGGLTVGATAVATGGSSFDERLTGFEEVPAVSTGASGQFRAAINRGGERIAFRLSYSGLEGDVTQAHIHLGQERVNGDVSVWLCSNLESPPTPPGTQACPAAPATVTGTITPADVVGPEGQGIAPGEFAELVRAMRAGVTYANVHSAKFPGGEIRGQLDHRDGGSGHPN
jgi:CHRD domain